MIRRRRSRRYTLLLAVVGLLAATLVAMPAAAELNPSFTYETTHNHAFGTGWEAGFDITVSVDDGRDDLAVTPSDPNNPNQWDLHDLDVAPGLTIQASNVLAGGTQTKTLDVQYLQVTSTDAESDTITGLGPPGDTVLVGPDGEFQASVDGGGTWTASLSTLGIDLQLWTSGYAAIDDADGDSTRFTYEVRPPGDLFVVRSDTESAGVGGQWWTYDSSISVVVRDGTEVKATAVSDDPPNPDSNYWWGTDVGIPVLPGWTVTATGNLTGHEVTTEVTDVVVEGWDNACTIYGTTTYDPTYLRVDVYSLGDDGGYNLSRYVDPVVPVAGVYNWTADFCGDPEPGESGDARNNDLVDPGGQAIHHDGGLGATMYHYPPQQPPDPPTQQGDLFVNANETSAGVGGQWWTEATSITVQVFDQDNNPQTLGNGQTTISTTTPPDPGSNYWWGLNTGIDIHPGWTVTATGDSGHKVTTEVSDVVVKGWDDVCAVWGTTTYDPAQLRLDVDSIDGDSSVHLSRYVTSTFDGSVYSWNADFCTDPGPGESGDAIIPEVNPLYRPSGKAIHHDGGLGQTMYNYSPPPVGYNPGVRAQPDWNSLWAWGWNPGAELHFVIDDDGAHDVEDAGTFLFDRFGETDGNGDAYLYLDDFKFQLQPGFDITVTDGTTTKTMVVADISFTVDHATGVVSGTTSLPDPTEHFEVLGFSGNQGVAGRWIEPVTASFTADLAAAPTGDNDSGQMVVPLQPGDSVGVLQVDEDGDETEMVWCHQCDGGGGPEGPTFTATVWPDASIQGNAWNGANLVITLDKAPWDGAPEKTLTLNVDTYEDGLHHDGWHFRVEAPFWDGWTLGEGDRVTVTASGGEIDGLVKTLDIRPIAITGADAGNATITGTANSGDSVTVMRWGDDLGRPHVETTVPVVDGSWSATLPAIYPESAGEAVIWDADGDATAASWGTPGIGAGFDGGDWYWVYGLYWYFDASVSVHIARAGGTVYEDLSVPAGEEWHRGFGTDLEGFDLEAGDVVTVVGNDTNTTLVHTVIAITASWNDWVANDEDGSGNTVYGTTDAPDGALVQVNVDEFDARLVTSVQNGSWSVDFDDFTEGEEIRIEPGIRGNVEVLGPNGNRTFAPWGDRGGEPQLIGEFQLDSRVYGHGFEGLEPLWLRVLHPSCPVVVPVGGDFEVAGVELCNVNELQPGWTVEVIDEQGEVVRELTLHNVVITSIDVGEDTISGTGDVGVPVEVMIEQPDVGPVAIRHADPNPDGTWTVWFNQPPSLEAGEWGQMEIDGQEGDAKQFEEDGDFTNSSWWDFPASMHLNVLDNYAVLGTWPTGIDITVTVFESDAMANTVHNEVIAAPGPYFRFDTRTDLGGMDLLTGHHVVASNGTVELSHTVTGLSITGFDFPGNSFYGTAGEGTTVAAGAWNNSSEGEAEGIGRPKWTADFDGQVNFLAENWIGGYVAELDTPHIGTFFYFDATYEALDNDNGTATTDDGRIRVVGLGDDNVTVVRRSSTPAECPAGFECIGGSWDLDWDGERRTWHNPLFLTLTIPAEDVPLGLDLDAVIVFKDGVEVPDCVLPLDSDSDFPCVSELLWEDDDDIKITVQTLEFSVLTTGFRTANADPDLGVDLNPVLVDEGSTASNTGTVSDLDEDAVTLSVNVGVVVDKHDGTWSWSMPTDDGPATHTVRITAAD